MFHPFRKRGPRCVARPRASVPRGSAPRSLLPGLRFVPCGTRSRGSLVRGGACSAGIVNPEFASFARHTASWFPAGSGPAPRGPSLHAPAHQCIVSPARPSRPCGSRPCSPPLWAPPPRLPLLLDLVMLAAVMTKPQAIWMQAAGISRITGAIVP